MMKIALNNVNYDRNPTAPTTIFILQLRNKMFVSALRGKNK